MHVCTPLPEHWVDPGTQTPEQAPLTHADETHAVAEPHWPFALHVCTPLFEQRFAPALVDRAHPAEVPGEVPLVEKLRQRELI